MMSAFLPGNPVQFVRSPLTGVPRAGATSVLFVSVSTVAWPTSVSVVVGRVSVGVPAAAAALRVAVPEVLPGKLAPVTPSVVKPVTPSVVPTVAAPAIATVPEALIAAIVVVPAIFAVVPTNSALATPMPPAVMIEPVVVLVASVTRLLSMPAANGMRWVATVWPSFVIAVDRPVPRSAVSALKAVDEMTVPVTTGWPLLLMLKVPEPL